MLKYALVTNEKTKECDVGLGTNTQFYQSIGMTEMEVEQAYNGSWYVKGYAPEKPIPTEEEIKQLRARAYQQEVDPITSHIQRLRDKEQTEEIITKINELIAERDTKVQEIVEKYPYPVDNLENIK